MQPKPSLPFVRADAGYAASSLVPDNISIRPESFFFFFCKQAPVKPEQTFTSRERHLSVHVSHAKQNGKSDQNSKIKVWNASTN